MWVMQKHIKIVNQVWIILARIYIYIYIYIYMYPIQWLYCGRYAICVAVLSTIHNVTAQNATVSQIAIQPNLCFISLFKESVL